MINKLDTSPNEAMEKLVEEYTALVWHIAAKYLLNTEDIKECVNDTFAEVYEHRKEYDETKGSLAVWIGTIAKHRAISMYRKLRKTEAQNMEDVADETDRIREAEESIDIEEAISKLSDTDREMIRMKYYEGMSISEIAESLNITYDTARKRHKRSVMNLKKLLMLTLALLALLALVACGIIIAYRHFQVVPGFGVMTEENAEVYVLPEPVTVQQGMFTVTVTKAAIYGDIVTIECAVEVPVREFVSPAFGEEGWKEPGRPLNNAMSLCWPDGSRVICTNSSGAGKNSDDFSHEIVKTFWPAKSEQKKFRNRETVDLLVRAHYVSFDGEYYDDISVPVTLVKTGAEELDEYAYLYDEELGGLMIRSDLVGDTLSLEVYPLVAEGFRYYAGLTQARYVDIQNDTPVTILNEEGEVFTGEPEYLPMSPYGQDHDHATFTFTGVTPGTYTLSVPYVYLLADWDESKGILLNLEDNTFEDKEISFPGGTMRVTEIRSVEPDPLMAEYNVCDYIWEIHVRCEMEDDKKTAVVFPYPDPTPNWKFIPYVKNLFSKDIRENYSVSRGILDEESGEVIFIFESWEEMRECYDFSRVNLRTSTFEKEICIRYEKPLEITFEVTE